MRLGAVMCTIPLDELTTTFRETLFGYSRMCQSPQGLTIFGYSFWGEKSQRRMYSTMAARNAWKSSGRLLLCASMAWPLHSPQLPGVEGPTAQLVVFLARTVHDASYTSRGWQSGGLCLYTVEQSPPDCHPRDVYEASCTVRARKT